MSKAKLEAALDRLEDVQLIDNTVAEAEAARREIVGIIRDLLARMRAAERRIAGLEAEVWAAEAARDEALARAAEAEARLMRMRSSVRLNSQEDL